MTRRVDHLTTLHPLWLQRLIAGPPSNPLSTADRREIDEVWQALSRGDFTSHWADVDPKDPLATEKLMLSGMLAFRRGQHDEAKKLWQRASAAQPESPLAWKSAAEAEGFGPFVRGMEVFCELPDKAYLAGTESAGHARAQRRLR